MVAEGGVRTFDLSVVTPDGAAFEGEAEEARAALERADAGDDEIDRWHMEQRLRHAENKIAVAGR